VNPNQNGAPMQTTKKTPWQNPTKARAKRVPRELEKFAMLNRVNVSPDAKVVLQDLAISGGADTRERVIQRLKRVPHLRVYNMDFGAGIANLIEEGLVEARDGQLHLRPFEEWRNEAHFMSALALRWPS
jgi:hypothetical protein